MKEYFEYGGYHFSGYRNFNHEEKKQVFGAILQSLAVINLSIMRLNREK